MPDYRCECVGTNGQAVVRVLSAESAEAAARAVLADGLKVVRVQRMAPPTVQAAPDFSPVAGKRRSAGRGQVVIDFFRFRLLWTPPLTQLLFALATIGLALSVAVIPLGYAEEVRQHAERVAPQRETVRMLESYIPRALELEAVAEEADREAREYEGRADFRIAHAKAAEKAESARRQARSTSPLSDVHSASDAEFRIQSLKQNIKAHMSTGPSAFNMLRSFALVALSWIALRLFLEFMVILFSIHDRLVELSDAARKSSGVV